MDTMRSLCLFLLLTPLAYGQKQIAITLDDLPVSTYSQTSDPAALAAQQQITHDILAALTKHHVPAIGFVNEVKMNTPGARDAYAAMLQAWLNAGMDLGCHGYSHLALSDTALPGYEADFDRGTVITPLMMQWAGKTEHFYRYPFNDLGDTPEKHYGFLEFLKQHGYSLAPITFEADDWLYAAVYDSELRKGDTATAEKLRDAYMEETKQHIAFTESLTDREFHHPIAQVALMHVNALNANMLDAVLTEFERQGYTFISLDKALADPAYATKDPYIGRAGIGWLERWAPTLGVPDPFKGDTDPPKWVMDLYKALTAK
jgi:peptidoglycan/xylan/chitin deacetylase (PgdA/CDA1 family)